MAEGLPARTDSVTIATERETCRACDCGAMEPVLDLGNQYLPRFVPGPDDTLPKAPLELMRCTGCGLLQLSHTVNPDLLFREFYYRSGINDSMRQALDELVRVGTTQAMGDRAARQRGAERPAWLDIGANDGFLLSRVAPGFLRYAVEPALNFKAELEEHADAVIPDYFRADTLNGQQFDVITSAAMFYDVDDPATFCDGIRKCLKPHGVWVNQLNDSPTMLKQNAFDAICHEHLCYYDVPSLSKLYRRHGLAISSVSFNDVNGGSIRVVARHLEEGKGKGDLVGLQTPHRTQVDEFATRIRKWADVFGELMSDLGPGVWCYGASTKGTVLLQYLGMPSAFEAVADRNPRKVGLKMVGSWTPIRSEEDFREAAPRYAVVLPWAFKKEFDQREALSRQRGTTFIYPLPEISFTI